MNYQKIYDALVESRRLIRPFDKKLKGFEYHHIIMRSMGGSDDKNNRVNLTCKEHFIAHRLLWMIHKNRETARAFFQFCHFKNKFNQREFNISSRAYTEARDASSATMSKYMREQWKNPTENMLNSVNKWKYSRVGKKSHWSEEARKIQSELKKKQYENPTEAQLNAVNNWQSKGAKTKSHWSEEARKIQSELKKKQYVEKGKLNTISK